MDPLAIIFILIFLLTILLSATGIVSMAVAALIGALLTAWFGLQYHLFTYNEALGFIDMRLIALLVGVMIVVEVTEKSGLYRFGALYAVKLAGGNPGRLFVALCLISAAVSMFLSDATAILLMAIATVTITRLLDYDPVPYFLSAAIMVNLGGMSTLIGSTSNMVIGIASGMNFVAFIGYLALCEFALWGVTIFALFLLFKSRLGDQKILPEYSPWKSIDDRKFFYRSIFILALLVVLFLTLEQLGVGPEAIALGCAIIALVFSGLDPAKIFKGLDWESLFFIAGFIFVVGGLEKTGLLSEIAQQFVQLAGGDILNTTLLVLWSSGLVSMLVSNTAVALTFTPIIQGFPGLASIPIWSGLILGTNLGGVATPLSGTVCIMAIGALKREGITLSFREFTKIGVITTMLQLGFASLYLMVRFGLIG